MKTKKNLAIKAATILLLAIMALGLFLQAFAVYENPSFLILEIVHDENADVDVPRSSGPIVFENYMKHKAIVKKVSADGEPLSGATFDIYRNGQFIFKDLPNGTYRITEIEAPTGYEPS